MLNILLTSIFILLLIYYSFFLVGILAGLRRLTPLENNFTGKKFVSIIIPFRNESINILESLKSLENQNYPKEKYEVIYVNDSSDDDSLHKIFSAEKSPNIKVISVPEEFSKNAHKKRAIRFGISNSSGEIILTTDADCKHHKNWLQQMLSCFDNETGFVSGPVEFIEEKTIFEKLQKLEFSGLVLTGAGLIGINKPVICNAANIAYSKAAYENVNGFNDQLNLSSGDDEMLMQKIWASKIFNVKFCWNRETVVLTKGNDSLEKFYHQRKRWASKGLFYADKFLILKLIFIFLFYLGLVVQLFLAIFYSQIFFATFSLSLIIKSILEYLILKRGEDFILSKKILRYFLPAEIFHIPYIIIAGIAGTFGNYVWKNRKIKR
ncbi:MAG: glycosyltransferase [Ignavibacteriaceae bacterium]